MYHIKGINTWAVPLVRYSRPFLKWIREEFKQKYLRTRRFMTMQKALHHRDDVDKIYVSRKERGRGLGSIEDSVDTSIQQLEDFIEKRGGRLITVTKNNTDNAWINGTKITRKQKWEEKQLYGHFKGQASDNSQEKTWTWLIQGNLKRETGFLLIATRNNAIKTNYIKTRIAKTQQNSKCRLCGDKDETMGHMISEYSKLAQKENKIRHDWVGKGIHRELCKKFKFNHTNKCNI